MISTKGKRLTWNIRASPSALLFPTQAAISSMFGTVAETMRKRMLDPRVFIRAITTSSVLPRESFNIWICTGKYAIIIFEGVATNLINHEKADASEILLLLPVVPIE
jgi:hypothetical protein